jgi:hypothetical protein
MRFDFRALAFAVITGFTLLASPPAGADAVDLPALLKRLATYSASLSRNDDTVDRTCTDRQEKLDGDGKVSTWVERVTRITHPGGREVKELVKATQDGKDVTAEWKAKDAEKKKGDAGAGVDAKNPFDAAEQGKYQFTIKGPAPNDPSKLLLYFAPKGKASTNLVIGHALVDPAKGELLKSTFRPSEYPSMVSEASLEWDTPPTPFGPLTTRFSFRGEGGILFIKQRLRGTIRCHDFAPSPGSVAPPR